MAIITGVVGSCGANQHAEVTLLSTTLRDAKSRTRPGRQEHDCLLKSGLLHHVVFVISACSAVFECVHCGCGLLFLSVSAPSSRADGFWLRINGSDEISIAQKMTLTAANMV